MKNLVVILVLVLCLNNINRTRSSNIHSRMQYFCGTRLVVALSLICETYNNPSEVEEDYSQRNGIIETCCQRPCSRRVLASYCGSLKEDTKHDDNHRKSSKSVKKKKNPKGKKSKKYNKMKKNKCNKIKDKKRRKSCRRKQSRKWKLIS